jgi:hypothetical protein
MSSLIREKRKNNLFYRFLGYSLVDVYRRFGAASISSIKDYRASFTSQKMALVIATALRTSNLTYFMYLCHLSYFEPQFPE